MAMIQSQAATAIPAANRRFSLGSLLRRPETGSFLGLLTVFVFFTIFGGENFASPTGAAKNGSKSTQLPLPASAFGNPTAVAEAIKATLLKDKSIDGLATISAGDADSAATGIEQAGATGKVKLASFDMNDTGLVRIKGGTQMFAVDQQPWLQGFLAVTLADAYVNYGLKLASAPILTGPGIVDTANIDATLAGAKAGYR